VGAETEDRLGGSGAAQFSLQGIGLSCNKGGSQLPQSQIEGEAEFRKGADREIGVPREGMWRRDG
jgi:hypothetical protein